MAALIGTLTFHRAINHGAVLQAYALQKAIFNLGFESELINYYCDGIEDNYSNKLSKLSIKRQLGHLLSARINRQRKEAFESFIEHNIRLSEVYTKDNIQKANGKYTAFIVGSDQVWNTTITNNDARFFLDFAPPAKRNSYAASLGFSKWDRLSESNYVNILKNYNMVSVREESAAKYLEPLIGKRPSVVADPVFLLTPEEWSAVSSDRLIKDDYLLLYCLGSLPSGCLQLARNLSNKLKLKLAVIYLGNHPFFSGVLDFRTAGPNDFLSLIRHASLVITPSFHGCCFSIIFKRNFYWYNSANTDASKSHTESRQLDLLSRFQLTNRICNDSLDQFTTVDYSLIDSNVKLYRDHSLRILSDMLSTYR